MNNCYCYNCSKDVNIDKVSEVLKKWNNIQDLHIKILSGSKNSDPSTLELKEIKNNNIYMTKTLKKLKNIFLGEFKDLDGLEEKTSKISNLINEKILEKEVQKLKLTNLEKIKKVKEITDYLDKYGWDMLDIMKNISVE